MTKIFASKLLLAKILLAFISWTKVSKFLLKNSNVDQISARGLLCSSGEKGSDFILANQDKRGPGPPFFSQLNEFYFGNCAHNTGTKHLEINFRVVTCLHLWS